MQIRLATLNVWALPEPISRDPQARIEAIGERLSGLDLDAIAFQEVWTRDAADQLIRGGRAAGLTYNWFGDGTFGNGGLLVLSRLLIEEVRFEAFAVTGAPEKVAANLEYLSGKGFATVKLSTPAGPLLFVNTHLHARYSSSSPHRHVPHRTGQTVQLAARFANSGEPIVAAGDFNFREGETDYRVLTGILGLRDVAAQLDNRQNTTLHSNPYRNPSGIDRRKDFIFVRDGRDRAVLPRTISRSFDEILEIDGAPAAYSNHAGLIVELELASVPATVASLPPVSAGPSRDDIFEAAAEMLTEGENLVLARQDGGRTLSGIGLGLAAAATVGAMPKRMSRRRLLRASLAAGALTVLAPSVGYKLASELLMPGELRAFREAARQLAALRPGIPLAAVSAGPPA